LLAIIACDAIVDGRSRVNRQSAGKVAATRAGTVLVAAPGFADVAPSAGAGAPVFAPVFAGPWQPAAAATAAAASVATSARGYRADDVVPRNRARAIPGDRARSLRCAFIAR
jgi:hypothetical protein